MRAAPALLAFVLGAITLSASPVNKRQDDTSDASADDLDALFADIPDPVLSAIPVTVTDTVVAVPTAAILASVSQAVVATPTLVQDQPSVTAAPSKRDSSCPGKQQSTIYTGTSASPDTVDGFKTYSEYVNAATGATTPSGYTQQFSNLQASTNSGAWYSLKPLSTYDVAGCASKCDADSRCNGFNIYFERDPTYSPDASTCPNPPSLTNVKCVLLDYAPTADTTTNAGQPRQKFITAITGSNGYVKNTQETAPVIPGFNGRVLGDHVLNLPTDNGYDTYMGVATFSGASLLPCGAACTGKTTYNAAHPDKDTGAYRSCNYFTAAQVYKNGALQGIKCSFYTKDWSSLESTTSRFNYGSNGNSYLDAAAYTIDDYNEQTSRTEFGRQLK